MEKKFFEKFNDLFEAVVKLESKEDCELFFEDICTIKEMEDMAQRLEVATLLKEGKNYREISEKTGASTATISRVNRCLVYGRGGYALVLGEQEEKQGE